MIEKRKTPFDSSIILPIIGSTLSAITYAIDINVNFLSLNVRPVHLLIWLIWLLGIESLVSFYLKGRNKYILISSGASLSLVIGYIINKGLSAGYLSSTPYMLLGGIVCSILLAINSISHNMNEKTTGETFKPRYVLWIITAITLIVAIRLTNIVNRNIPNEMRSIIVSGIEIHHFLTGLLLVPLSQIMLYIYYQSRGVIIISSFLIIVGLTLITDQLTYIIMYPLSDEAFFSYFSLIGAGLGMLWFIFRIYSLKNRVITTTQNNL